ncbi:hypothetical protein NKG05_14350 [Oerskovia sp. M15]
MPEGEHVEPPSRSERSEPTQGTTTFAPRAAAPRDGRRRARRRRVRTDRLARPVGAPHVNETTRNRVLAAVEQTGYRRNSLARALVTGRSRTLGVITHETDFYSGSAMMLGMQRAARDGGYFVSTASTASLSPRRSPRPSTGSSTRASTGW